MAFEKSLILAVLCICGASAQVSFPGGCPAQEVVSEFNLGAYLGKWYEIESYFQVFAANAICSSANYSDNGNGTIKVYNTQFVNGTLEFSSITGSARQVDGVSGKLAVTFPVSAGEAPYWVLDTDYENYSIVWACRDYITINFQTLWFLARERDPSQEVRDYVFNFLTNRGISTDNLNVRRQTDCPEEPEPAA